jgi:putative cell wall-binding protein
MIKRIPKLRLFISSLISTLVLTLAFSTSVYADTTTTRLAGADRYATSSAIAQNGWTTSAYAVLASGQDYPDALAAAPLAGKYKAPILLTEQNAIPSSTLATITKLGVSNIFLIGGTGSISTAVETKLKGMGITVTRLAGATRYDTDIAVAEQLGTVSQVAVVTGQDYADALSIAPIAVKFNMPIILVETDSIPASVASYLATQPIITTYVVGKGTSILDTTGLPNITEINGADKYERNIAIISAFKSSLNFSTIYLATGEGYADALSGSVLAGLNSNPLFLVGSDVSIEKNLIQLIAPTAAIKILGGTGVLPDNTVTDITTPGTTTSVLTTIQVTSPNVNYSISGYNQIAYINYKAYDQYGKDITSTSLAANLTFTSGVGTITGSNGTAILTVPSSISLASLGTITIAIADSNTGVSASPTLTLVSSATTTSVLTTIQVTSPNVYYNISGYNQVAYISYKVYDQYGKDITSTSLAANLTFTSGIGTITGSNGTAKLTVPSSTSLGTITITIADSNTGVSASRTLSLVSTNTNSGTNTDNNWRDDSSEGLTNVDNWTTSSTNNAIREKDRQFKSDLAGIRQEIRDIESDRYTREAAKRVDELKSKYNEKLREYKDWLDSLKSGNNGYNNNNNNNYDNNNNCYNTNDNNSNCSNNGNNSNRCK